ncbi:MAG: hypothetical protein K2Q21_14435 [Chitinophagaceae bacterium]|nr:hypothetical protein [Chitinophagaceae bacterium]
MPHILILGGTTFDHIISLNEFPKPIPQTIHHTRFFETVGSTGTGKSVCLKKLELPSTLYSILGDDLYGKKIIDYLKKEEVEFIYDIDSKGTERHFNIMDKEGNRISMFITQSSEHPKMNKALIEKNIQKSDLIVLNIISYCKEFIPLLKDYPKPIWTDLHDYTEGNEYHQPFIDASNYIFLSSDNLKNYKAVMQEFIELGKELVVCTHGKKGATALTKNAEWVEEPALTAYQMIDTNGAGDNFFSGFLYAHLNEMPIKDCMRYGTLCAALCIGSQQIVSERLTSSLLKELYIEHYTS